MRMQSLSWFLLFLLAGGQALAQDRPYSEGPVSVVTSVKIHDGQFDNYMNYLAKTYKPVMEAQKKAGHVVEFSVYNTRARSADEPDLYLVVTYANMAAFDGLADRAEEVARSVTGQNREQASAATIERGKMREIMGSELIRELVLK